MQDMRGEDMAEQEKIFVPGREDMQIIWNSTCIERV